MAFNRMTSAGYLTNRLARLYAKHLHDRISPLGIVPGQFPALLALWEKDGQTQKELLSLLDIEQATLANTLARMERDGLIIRKEHAADGRSRIIQLTEKAKKIRDPSYAAAMEINKASLSGLSEDEAEVFLALMRKVIAALAEEEETGA